MSYDFNSLVIKEGNVCFGLSSRESIWTPKQKCRQNVHHCGGEIYLEVDTCHWALSHYNAHGNHVVFSSFLLPCKSDVHLSLDHATFQPKIC